jgi:hypothetical protein
MATVQGQTLPPNSFLDTHRQDELDALFASLPAATGLDGVYRGRLMGIRGLSWLPGVAKWAIYGVLGTWLNPWRGKQFTQARGANLWGIGPWALPWGEYRIIVGNDQAPLKLDYEVPANPRLLRPILGEVRQFSDGVLLARMRYRTRKGITTLLYFTLREQG